MAGRTTHNAHVNVSHDTREANVLTVKPVTPFLFRSFRLPGALNNSYGVTETPNVHRGDARVNHRPKKLEQLSVQQIQNARLKPASLPSYVRRAKSANGDQNVKLKRFGFPRLYNKMQSSEGLRFSSVIR